MQGQDRAHGEEEVQPGQGEEDVRRPHQDGVHPAAVEPGHRAQHRAHPEGQHGREEAGEQRDARAMEKA